jgi:hypothetical protein
MRKKNPGSICTAVVKLPVMLNCLFHPAASGPVACSLRTWSHVVWWYDSMLAISSLIPNDVYWSKPWPLIPKGKAASWYLSEGAEDGIRQEDIVTHIIMLVTDEFRKVQSDSLTLNQLIYLLQKKSKENSWLWIWNGCQPGENSLPSHIQSVEQLSKFGTDAHPPGFYFILFKLLFPFNGSIVAFSQIWL